MPDRERSDIDISHIRTSGLAGLGLVMVAVVAYALPALRWLAVACLEWFKCSVAGARHAPSVTVEPLNP